MKLYFFNMANSSKSKNIKMTMLFASLCAGCLPEGNIDMSTTRKQVIVYNLSWVLCVFGKNPTVFCEAIGSLLSSRAIRSYLDLTLKEMNSALYLAVGASKIYQLKYLCWRATLISALIGRLDLDCTTPFFPGNPLG